MFPMTFRRLEKPGGVCVDKLGGKTPPRAQGFLSVLSDPGPHWLAPSDYLNEVEDPETLTLG